MKFTLQTANVKADAKNSFYPNRAEVKDAASLQQAVAWDHVCAQYRNNHRGNAEENPGPATEDGGRPDPEGKSECPGA